jgi:hypothetical protein
MVKLTLKLAVVGLIANALYQVVPPFYTSWQFSDAMKELAAYPGWRATVPTMQQRCAKIAKEHGLELVGDDFEVKLTGVGNAQVATIDVSYEVVMKPIPGRAQSHVFVIHAEGGTPRFGSVTP